MGEGKWTQHTRKLTRRAFSYVQLRHDSSTCSLGSHLFEQTLLLGHSLAHLIVLFQQSCIVALWHDFCLYSTSSDIAKSQSERTIAHSSKCSRHGNRGSRNGGRELRQAASSADRCAIRTMSRCLALVAATRLSLQPDGPRFSILRGRGDRGGLWSRQPKQSPEAQGFLIAF